MDKNHYKAWEFIPDYPGGNCLLPEDSKALSKMLVLHMELENDKYEKQEKAMKEERNTENKITDPETANLIPSKYQKSIAKNKKIIDVNNLKRQLHDEIMNEVAEEVEEGILD